MAAPFLWPVIYLWRDNDASERAERLLNVWPVLMVFSALVAILTIRRRRGIAVILPFVIIGAIHGAFMSQQLWGSTYAIWPLFMIMLTTTIADLTFLNLDSQLVSKAGGVSLRAKRNEGFWYSACP